MKMRIPLVIVALMAIGSINGISNPLAGAGSNVFARAAGLYTTSAQKATHLYAGMAVSAQSKAASVAAISSASLLWGAKQALNVAAESALHCSAVALGARLAHLDSAHKITGFKELVYDTTFSAALRFATRLATGTNLTNAFIDAGVHVGEVVLGYGSCYFIESITGKHTKSAVEAPKPQKK